MKPPQIQLGLLPGFEGPILPAAPIELEPPKPPAAPEPPAWLFGPRHRELDAQRHAAAEAARHAPDAPPATSLPKLCPCCLQPLPGGVL